MEESSVAHFILGIVGNSDTERNVTRPRQFDVCFGIVSGHRPGYLNLPH